MHLKFLSSTTLLLFTLPLLLSAQIKPGPSQIVCLIDPDETPAALVNESGWKNSEVSGFLIRQSWASLEPAPGNYNFALFDRAVQLAHENGKFIGLAVGGGTLSPSWLYASGAVPFRSNGQTEKMPLPWDPVFQSAWGSTVEALGNRYDKDPAVAYVVLSGVGRDYDSSLFSASKDVNDFEATGGQLFWSHAAGDIADLYATSFPHTRVVYPMGSVIPGAMGEKLVDAVVAEQLESHSGQFGFTAASDASGGLDSGLSAASSPPTGSGIRVGPTEDLQDTISSTLQSGLLQRATYMEVPSQQISQGDQQPALQQAVQQLAQNSGTTATVLVTQLATTGSSATSTRKPAVTSAAVAAATAASNAAIAASMTAAAEKAADSGQPIWVTAAQTGRAGAGTQSDPLNFSTAARLDTVITYLSSIPKRNLTFHFLAGTYYTTVPGAYVNTGWQFLGAGEGSTIIKLDSSAMTYALGGKNADSKTLLAVNGSGGVLIKDMTLDGNCTGFGSQLNTGFAMPAPRSTVTVNVKNSSTFTVGKWVYVQDSAPTAGVNLYYGLMEVTAIPDATHLTLMNSEVATPGTVKGNLVAGSPVITGISSVANLDQGQAISGPGIPANTTISTVGSSQITISANATATQRGETLDYAAVFLPNGSSHMSPTGNVARGTSIPSTAYVLVAVSISGVILGYTNDTIENVDIRNVAEPFYEGPAGISVNGYGKDSTVLVQNCSVDNTWGTNAWLIDLNNTKGVRLIGNSVTGNGYHQGYSFVGDSSSATLQNNTVQGCQFGLFSDTGTKTNLTVTGNTFGATYCINFAGAAVSDSTFSNNTLKVSQSGGIGMQFIYVQLTDSTFTKNNLEMAPGLINLRGITFETGCGGSGGNVFSDNMINSALPNSSVDPAYGTQSGNTNQYGQPISLGLND
jgi:hypothetical protein